MTYQPDALGAGMAIFDALPKPIRDALNDGVATQTAEKMWVVDALCRQRGIEHVLRVLEKASEARLAERRY